MIRRPILTLGALAGTALITACGGGDSGGIARTPPPPGPAVLVRTEYREVTPLESNPAWSGGTYDALVIDRSSGKAEPTGAFRISVDAASKTYALAISAGTFARLAASYDFTAQPSELPIGSRYRIVQHMSDGRTVLEPNIYYQIRTDRAADLQRDADTRLRTYLSISGPEPRPIGSLTPPSSYTALGEWGAAESRRQSDGSFAVTGQEFSAYLAFGSRTAASDIPAGGSARYAISDDRGDYLACDYACSIPDFRGTTNLTVDFAARAIEAAYRWSGDELGYGADGNTRIGSNRFSVTAAGRSPIDRGAFVLHLAGTGSARFTRSDGSIRPDETIPVGGLISGALFGPQAAEMAGVYRLPALGLDERGNLIVRSATGAFTALQSRP